MQYIYVSNMVASHILYMAVLPKTYALLDTGKVVIIDNIIASKDNRIVVAEEYVIFTGNKNFCK